MKCRDKEERQGREVVRRGAGKEERPIILRLRHSRELVGIALRMAAHCCGDNWSPERRRVERRENEQESKEGSTPAIEAFTASSSRCFNLEEGRESEENKEVH